MINPCAHGKEIADALESGRWPHACGTELLAHAETCRSCSDLILVTQTFQRARRAIPQKAHFDSPSLLWWRAQLRQRNAAVERVGQPLKVAYVFALLVNVLIVAGFVAWQFWSGVRWAAVWSGVLRAQTLHLDTAWSFASMKLEWILVLLIPGIGVASLVSFVVLYFASEER
jgi:hypothetical protein